ncbi:MAG: hypothetical protein LBI68_03315 [Azoarcus sp.]|nr:hypothetical protein [Azoarcus sp.]
MSRRKADAEHENILSALLATAFLSCAAAQGMADEKEDFSRLVYDTPPLGHFDFEQDPDYSMIVQEIKAWITVVRYEGKNPGTDKVKRWNHFCAVGYTLPVDPNTKEEFSKKTEVTVYWKEERILTFWTGSYPKLRKGDAGYGKSLTHEHHFSMDDILPRKDLETTFLGGAQLIKEDAENTVADCEKHGNQYIIGPFTPPFEEH